MGFGDILGQMMQQGGRGGSGGGLDQVLRQLGGSGGGGAGGGMGGLLSQLQGALGGAGGTGAGGGGFGGLAERSKDFFGKEQAGGMTGGQIGGISALAGALLGGGAGGAVKGGAMAVLGTLAISALRNAQARSAGEGGLALEAAPEEIAAVSGPESEKLMLSAMISAAKADGQIDQQEMEKIIGKAGADTLTDAEKSFIMSEMQGPVDIGALVAKVTSPTQAAAVYAASLLAVNVDTDVERAYLAELAAALNLDPTAVSTLETTTGA